MLVMFIHLCIVIVAGVVFVAVACPATSGTTRRIAIGRRHTTSVVVAMGHRGGATTTMNRSVITGQHWACATTMHRYRIRRHWASAVKTMGPARRSRVGRRASAVETMVRSRTWQHASVIHVHVVVNRWQRASMIAMGRNRFGVGIGIGIASVISKVL